MKVLISEEDLKIIEQAEKIVGHGEREGRYMELDDLTSIIDNLIYEVHCLEEKIDDLEQDINDNYEPRKVDYYIEYGLHPHDFY